MTSLFLCHQQITVEGSVTTQTFIENQTPTIDDTIDKIQRPDITELIREDFIYRAFYQRIVGCYIHPHASIGIESLLKSRILSRGLIENDCSHIYS